MRDWREAVNKRTIIKRVNRNTIQYYRVYDTFIYCETGITFTHVLENHVISRVKHRKLRFIEH